MKKFLRSFQDQAAYDAAKQREDFYKPCVSLIGGSSLQYDPLAAVPEGFVDLGLPSGLLWYSKNIGATNGNTAESWYGNYYAWGSTQTQESYDGNNCPYCTLWDDEVEEYRFTKYIPTDMTDYWDSTGDPDNKLVLDLTDDVANVTFGFNYRMPTQAELNELIALPNQWVTNYNGVSGLNGKLFTGNGNTLFIPAAGYYHSGSDIRYVGSDCRLWSSSLCLDSPNYAYGLYFVSDDIGTNYYSRFRGFNVRPVLSVS